MLIANALVLFWNNAAALLLQGSIQVYSRKVEYLYTLVVHALEFISQKRFDFYATSKKFFNL